MLEERREYHQIFREPVGLTCLRKDTGRYELMSLKSWPYHITLEELDLESHLGEDIWQQFGIELKYR